MGSENESPTKSGVASDAFPANESVLDGPSDYFIDPVKERKMMRKFDVSQAPCPAYSKRS